VNYTAIEPKFYDKQDGHVGAHNPTSDLIQKSVAELASHGLSVARTQEALPALPNQNDEDAAKGEAGRQFRSEFLNQVTRPASGFFASSPAPESVPGQALVLTNAERNVALLVSEGARNHDIARQLGVSHRTVESHLSNIFAKLGLSSRVQLAVWISGAAKPES
jgi:DNA-binding NarL/FixJ family response regulator